MPDGRFAILDPVAGISGDMLLGALLAAGAPPEWLEGFPLGSGSPDVTVEVGPVDRCGVQATKVNVLLPGGARKSLQPDRRRATPTITRIMRTSIRAATVTVHGHGPSPAYR